MSVKPRISKILDQIGDAPSDILSIQLAGLGSGTDTPITSSDTILSAFENLQAQISAGSGWSLGGNTLGSPSTLGSNDGVNWGLVRGGTEFITMTSIGALFTNSFGQADTGAFAYNATSGRLLIVPSNGSTSGGAFFGVYGTSGGTTLGVPHLDNSVNITQFIGGGAVNTFLADANGNLLLGNSGGITASARLDIRTFNNSDGTSAIYVENSSVQEIFRLTNAGNLTNYGNVTLDNGYLFVKSYTSLSETDSVLATVLGNSVRGDNSAPNTVIKTSADPGAYITLRYDEGINFITGLAGGIGTTYTDNTGIAMNIDNNQLITVYGNIKSGNVLFDFINASTIDFTTDNGTYAESWLSLAAGGFSCGYNSSQISINTQVYISSTATFPVKLVSDTYIGLQAAGTAWEVQIKTADMTATRIQQVSDMAGTILAGTQQALAGGGLASLTQLVNQIKVRIGSSDYYIPCSAADTPLT